MRLTILGVFLSLTSVFAVDMSQVSNEDILSEVSRRLSGGQNSGTATVIYACNTYGDLIITIAGGSNSAEMSFRDLGVPRCDAQIQSLRKYKAQVTGTIITAICNRYGDLVKLPMQGSGRFGTETSNNSVSYDACIVQAKIINGASGD